MKLKNILSNFETKLVLIQFFLAMPLIVLALSIIIYGMRSAAIKEVNNSLKYSLKTAASSFDQIYLRTIKLLEKPYTDRTIYKIINKNYKQTEIMKKYDDNVELSKLLLSNLLYYEPNISSVTLISEISNEVYYKRLAPSTSVNIHNPDWFNLRESKWYKDVLAVETPVISPAAENELYLKSGITISVAQRLKDVFHQKTIGAIRLDLNISTMYPTWDSTFEAETFVILDQIGNIVYSNSADFLKEYPLLTTLHTSELEKKYSVNLYVAPESKFTFIYLNPELSFLFGAPLLVGVPIFLSVICVLYVFVFIRFSSRYVSRPIQTLKTAMVQGQQKDLSTRCMPLNGEMGELSDAFNSLMQQMEELVSDITKSEHEKSKLAYEVLQSKVNPHFLYNTLNAIRWKADLIGGKEISNALESLASLLRFSIKCMDDIVPFETELEQLENYIKIMRVRYDDEIEINFDIDEECLSYKCLKFLIQPIVENCYIHAFGNKLQTDKMIMVKITCETDCIRMVVEDNGDGMTQEQINCLFDTQAEKSKSMFVSIGIGNVKQRIHALFGNDYDLKIESRIGEFTKVTAHIPLMKISDHFEKGMVI